jgi:uncharacterized protein (TIGR02246 family)
MSIDDRTAIQDLFTRYATALDGGDVAGVVSCFAPGAILESPVVGIKSGEAEIRAFAEKFSAFQASGAQLRHILTNFAIAVDGDKARATCYLVNILTRDGQTQMGPPGRYDCTLSRVNGAWLFQHRLVVLDGVFKLDGI